MPDKFTTNFSNWWTGEAGKLPQVTNRFLELSYKLTNTCVFSLYNDGTVYSHAVTDHNNIFVEIVSVIFRSMIMIYSSLF